MQDIQEIINRIKMIAKSKNVSVNKALLDSGIGKDFVANMRKGQIPSIDKFSSLSEYLGISIDYLINGKEFGNTFNTSQTEQDVVIKYRCLDDHGRRNVDQILNNEYERCTDLLT